MPDTSLIHELQARGLIAQTTDGDGLTALLERQSCTLYCGFDPTADSLHLGHLVPLLTLARFQRAGHRPIALVGGATGMIGDPSFKSEERRLNMPDVVAAWVDKIRRQLEPFLLFEGENAAIIVNNHDWFGRMNVLDFLRDIGKHFSVNAMISKESVKQRINRDETGISFTEFSYGLLQGYDFVELNKRHHCRIQIGGSDQWGNITAGIDLTRRLNQQHVFGLTLPLVSKADGTKFGKTEEGAIWLDPGKTTPYRFYQFWLGTADADVYRFLRYFTFMPEADIAALEAGDRAAGNARQAQQKLAELTTALVHGPAAVDAARRISQALFTDHLDTLTANDFAQLAHDGLPHVKLRRGTALVDTMAAADLAKSKGEARTFISSGAVVVNGCKVSELDYVFGDRDFRFGRYTLLRRGKKNYCLVNWQD